MPDQITIGSRAPDFTLNDFRGKPVTLSGYQGKQAVVLVFLRGFG